MERSVRWLLGAALAFASFGAFAGPVNINTADAATLATDSPVRGRRSRRRSSKTAPSTASSTPPML